MQKKVLITCLALLLTSTIQVHAQYYKNDTTYKKWYVGSTLFLLGNFSSINPPGFAQLNFGYRLTGKDVVSVEIITWKHSWPLGINPFYNDQYGKPETKFPGNIREYGIGLAYQRYLWKGLYLAVHATPMRQIYRDENGKNVGYSFIIFNTYRIGYHIKLFKDRMFIEPSLGIAGRPYQGKMPEDFKKQDDKWPKWTPEPGLHFGLNF